MSGLRRRNHQTGIDQCLIQPFAPTFLPFTFEIMKTSEKPLSTSVEYVLQSRRKGTAFGWEKYDDLFNETTESMMSTLNHYRTHHPLYEWRIVKSQIVQTLLEESK